MQRDLLFTGNITREIQFDNTQKGTRRARFTLALNEGERGSENEKSHFLSFAAFGELAEALEQSNITTKVRLNVVARVDSYKKPVYVEQKDSDDLKEVDLNMLSFVAWDVSPSMRYASVKVTPLPFKDGKGNEDGEEAPTRKAPTRKAPAKAPAKTAAKVPAAAGDVADDEDF